MKNLDVHALDAALRSDSPPTLIDVRSGMEFAGGHVPEAMSVPLGSVASRVEELRGKGPVYVICQSGARSAQAAGLLEAKGIEVVNITGGTGAWRAAGLPVATERSVMRLVFPMLACATLGLAPFTPEPHIVGKIRWVAGGAVGMGAMDWGDLLFHGAPWVWLLVTVVSLARTPAKPGA